MAKSGTIPIAHDGDVILRVGGGESKLIDGSNALNLRVSSHVLSNASRVFKALFSPRFSEGATLSSVGSVEIPLPNDEPESMRIMCAALHFKLKPEDDNISSPTLLSLARLSDKYDCAAALRHCFYTWFTEGDFWTLLATARAFNAAYIIQDHRFVDKFGQNLIAKYRMPIRTTTPGLEGLPVEVVEELEIKRHELRDEIYKFLEQQLEGLFTISMPGYECPSDCPNEKIQFGQLAQELRNYALWPISSLESTSLNEILSKLERVHLHEPPYSSCPSYSMYSEKCKANNPSRKGFEAIGYHKKAHQVKSALHKITFKCDEDEYDDVAEDLRKFRM
ncbi:hypothetical protein K431DRAFT_343440 [Polychaeton citri CBS 116435]|uniref:BTB domain-containing protein n=1 Tax=Polychaeton citri CBS 116435 TaxID=1314669 RepID=A0A9P4QCY7_9PEZI|nr:hypothetical protein K431DRAFT_343440 [Polychaeton citri CBS 116435]